MRLHYYTTAVPNSYCVGVHNGHGFGSLFARLFSKVAARTVAKVAIKTAARAAAKVARVAGRKALKFVTTKGADIAKKAAKQAIKQAVETGGNFAAEKIASLTEKALNTKLPEDLVHSISDIAQQGVKAAKGRVTKAADRTVETAINKGVTKAEQVAGIKRKQPPPAQVARRNHGGKRRKQPGVHEGIRIAGRKQVTGKRQKRDEKWNSLVQRMNEDE